MRDLSLELIFKGLRSRRDIDFSRYKEGTIKRRLARRMTATGCDNYNDYLDCLEKDPEEYGRLFRDLTIKVSCFFRNRAVFEILSDKIFPDIMSAKERKNDSTIRIWCAGCSFGEEVYSVAITLVEYLKKRGKKIDDYNISIFGTDIDDKALERARAGVYGDVAVRGINKEILNGYFIFSNPTSLTPLSRLTYYPAYLLIDSIKNMVSFSEHNLTSGTKMSPPAGIVANYDLILCRNLLIYFSVPLQTRAFSNIFNSLNPGGYIILGKSESLPEYLKPFLAKQNSGHRVYKKI
jgi:chemotaxis methyl-accepting protein methylase